MMLILQKIVYRRLIPLHFFDIIELTFRCVELVRAFAGHITYSYPLAEFCTFYNILQATSYQWPVNEHSVEERFQGSVLQSDPKLISLLCAVYIVRIQFNFKIKFLYELLFTKDSTLEERKIEIALFIFSPDFLQKL